MYVHFIFGLLISFFRQLAGPQNAKCAQLDITTKDNTAGEQYVFLLSFTLPFFDIIAVCVLGTHARDLGSITQMRRLVCQATAKQVLIDRLLFLLQVLSLQRNDLLTYAGCHVPDHSPVMGTLFCICLLTMGLRLCTFCSLHFWTLRDHYCATIRNMI